MLALSLAIFALLQAVHAQTDNIFTAQPIRTSDGSCLSAVGSYNNAPVTLRSCDNSNGQKWDVSIGGQYITDSGFAIFILSGTNSCLDSVANNGNPGIYSCGGRSDGAGSQSSHQAFTYSSFAGVTGPLVLIPRSQWMNNGQGPGQTCLSVAQGTLTTVTCDPSTISSQQQFYIGSPPTPPTPTPPSPPTLPPFSLSFQFPSSTQFNSFPNSSPSPNPPQSSNSPQASQASQSSGSPQSPHSSGSSQSDQSPQSSGTLPSNHSPESSGSLQSDQSTGYPQSPKSPQSDNLPQSSHSSSHSPSSSSGTSSSSSPSRRSVNRLAIALPLALAALIALLVAFLISRRRRRSTRNGERQNARPFLETQNATPSKGDMMDFRSGSPLASLHPATVASSSTPPSTTSEENAGLLNTSQSQRLPQMQPSVDMGMNAVDIDRIVSLVAARIDNSTVRNHPNAPTSDITTVPSANPQSSRSLDYASSSQSPGLSSTSPLTPPPASVNIDTILSLLAARVDPSFPTHNGVRDSQDRPPSYLIPPGYNV